MLNVCALRLLLVLRIVAGELHNSLLPPLVSGDDANGGGDGGGGGGESREHTAACAWRHNLATDESLSLGQLDQLESCIYYFVAQREPSHFALSHEAPPFEYPLRISVVQFIIHQVDMASFANLSVVFAQHLRPTFLLQLQQLSSTFNIHGEMYIVSVIL